METLLVALMTWASAHTGIPAPEEVPEVAFVSEERLWHTVHPDRSFAARGHIAVAGAYRDNVIYLPEDWDKRDLGDLSNLVHELVHHLQDHAGLEYRCQGKRERPAYDAQIAWVEAAGEDPWETIGMNQLFYLLATTCEPRTQGGGGVGRLVR